MKAHLSIAELEANLKEACSIDQYQRRQVITLRTRNPKMSVKEAVSFCMVSYKTVTQWSWLYNTQGPEALLLSGRGGRHRCLLSIESEKALLKSMQEKALSGVKSYATLPTCHRLFQASLFLIG